MQAFISICCLAEYVRIFVAKIRVTIENCVTGIKVERGVDWKDDDLQDHQNGQPGLGHITECVRKSKVAKVQWANGKDGWYHIGASGKYDLYLIGGMSKIKFFLSYNISIFKY